MKSMIRNLHKALTVAGGLGVVCSMLYGSAAIAGSAASSGQSYYAGLSCDQLWYERNKIFAAAGLCFKSDRGIEVFGTRCFPPYGELPNYKREVVSEILSYERAKGCR